MLAPPPRRPSRDRGTPRHDLGSSSRLRTAGSATSGCSGYAASNASVPCIAAPPTPTRSMRSNMSGTSSRAGVGAGTPGPRAAPDCDVISVASRRSERSMQSAQSLGMGSAAGSEMRAASEAGSRAPSEAGSRGSRRSRGTAASSQRSGIGELRPRSWHPPTRELLGDEPDDASSYCSSMRTATTIREFFEEDQKWSAGANQGRSHRQPPPWRPPPLPEYGYGPSGDCGYGPSGGMFTPAAQAACVLPGVPRGVVPGGRRNVGRAERLFSPHPGNGAPIFG